MKKNNKHSRKFTDKQIMIFTAIFSFIIVIGIILFALKDNFKKDKPQDVNWGEIDEEGEVSTDSSYNEPVSEIETYEDSNHQLYKRVYIYSMGISVLIPDDWEVDSSNPDVIYFKNDGTNEAYKGTQLVLTGTELTSQKIEDLPYNMYYFIRDNLKYEKNGEDLKANTYVTNATLLNTITDPNKKVWVETSNPDIYEEYEEKPDVEGIWEQKDKFVAIEEVGTVRMDSKYNSKVNENVLYDFYYTLKNNKEYMIAAMSTNTFFDPVAELAKTTFESIEYIREEDGAPIRDFDKKYNIGNMSFKIPSDYVVSVDNDELFRAECRDFTKKDFGIGVSIYKRKCLSNMDFEGIILENPVYAGNLLNAYSNNKVSDLIGEKTENEIILSFGEAETISISDKNAKRYNTSLSLATRGTELDVKSERSYPHNGITYVIMDKENMDIYVVSLTYGMSNEKTAQKYARALTKTMNFK